MFDGTSMGILATKNLPFGLINRVKVVWVILLARLVKLPV